MTNTAERKGGLAKPMSEKPVVIEVDRVGYYPDWGPIAEAAP